MKSPLHRFGWFGVCFFFGTSLLAKPEPLSIPLVDLHVDLSYQVNYMERDAARASGQLLATELIASNVFGLVLPLYIPHDVSKTGPRLSDLESSYARMMGVLATQEPYAVPGCHADPTKVRTWFSFEGAAPFAEHPELVEKWVNNGVRIWGLVHSHDNALASSAGLGQPKKHVPYGLTEQGRAVVRAVFSAGGIVDVSHASDRATSEVLELGRQYRGVVLATHSNTRAVAHHARNLTDEHIRGIAELGGVVGVNFHDEYLAVGHRATIKDIVRHVQHIVQLVGIEHAAIGSDFEGSIDPPKEIRDVRDHEKVARALVDSGMSVADVHRVFSGNILKLLDCHLVHPG
jgi:membrane dipeptidase